MRIEIPEVTVDESYRKDGRSGFGGKYVIVTLADGRSILWANNVFVDEHKELVDELESRGFGPKCCGGGMLYMSLEDKKIYLWDSSVRYGSDDKEQTTEMLKRAFPDFAIVLEEPRKPMSVEELRALKKEQEEWENFGKG